LSDRTAGSRAPKNHVELSGELGRPGAVDTPMTEAMYSGNSMNEEVAGRYALRRTGQPAELAQAILFLTAASSSFVTGIALPVDGGRTFH
jgi:NAD(P)-dependent dehydrogenase (short-subunit alcohol dehydrogenase family)